MGREFENLTLEVSEPIQKLAILNLFCLGYLRSAIVIFNLELDAPVVGGYTVCLGRPHHPSASCFLPVCSPGCIKTKIYSPLSFLEENLYVSRYLVATGINHHGI